MASGLLVLLICAQTPEFQTSLSREQIAKAMHVDGEGERASVIPFATMGAATMLGAGLLLSTDSKVGQGAAWPLLTIGALEVLAGVFFAARAGPHMRHLDDLLLSDPAESRASSASASTGSAIASNPCS